MKSCILRCTSAAPRAAASKVLQGSLVRSFIIVQSTVVNPCCILSVKLQVVPGSGGTGHAGERLPKSYRKPGTGME
jgi:hypothetical protein